MSNKKYWDNQRNTNDLGQHTDYADQCFQYFKEKNYTNLLHIGCGNGRDSAFFAQYGLDVDAIDISPNAIKLLDHKNISNIRGIVQDISTIKYPENTFDVIYANLSLHYFDDKQTTSIFHNLFNILKPHGTIFIRCKSTKDELCPPGTSPGQIKYIEGCDRNFFDKTYMKEKLGLFNTVTIAETSSIHYQYNSHFIEAIATK